MTRDAWYVGSVSRVMLVEGGAEVDVFEVVDITEQLARVRSPYLFEVGEELALRIEEGSRTRDVTGRVRAHVGAADDKVTEIELR